MVNKNFVFFVSFLSLLLIIPLSSAQSVWQSITHGQTLNENFGNLVETFGVVINTGSSPIWIDGFTKTQNDGSTKGFLRDPFLQVLDQCDFLGNYCNFPQPVQLATNASYQIVSNGNGSAVSRWRRQSVLPINSNYFIWDHGWAGTGPHPSDLWTVMSLNITNTNPFPPPTSPNLSDNLAAYYGFEEGTGTTTQSSVSNYPILSLINMNNSNWLSNGVLNNYLTFNGVNQLAVNPLTNLNSLSQVSVQAWVKPISYNQDSRVLYFRPTPLGQGIEMGTLGNQANFCVAGPAGVPGGGIGCVVTGSQLLLNQWTHIIATYNGYENKIYINGQLAATNTAYSAQIGNFTGFLSIGRHVLDDPNRYWHGAIDEVGIWTRVLNANEVLQLYNNGNGLPYSSFGIFPPTPPTLSQIGPQQTTENQTLAIQLSATDPNNDTLTFLTNAQSVLPSPFSFNNTSGLFEWTPTFQNSGIYNVTFYVTDGTFIDSETITITVIDFSFAAISTTGTPSPGNTVTFFINNPEFPNADYIFSGSFGTAPGMPLGDGRVIPLNNDWLLNALLFVPQIFGFYNTTGTLNSQGQGIVTWNIPQNLGGSGITLHFSFITTDFTQTGSQIVTSIAPAIPITMQ